ncbi:MAG TPA: chloride channel protein [Pseudobdellovibrionaceae bacterium]|jgi:H+/Cl- antiporter ClcA
MSAILFGLLCFIFVIMSVGSLAALFLFLLEQTSQFFLSHDHLVLLLPLLGIVTGFTYWLFGKKLPTTKKILHGVEDQHALIPFLTALLIFFFTVVSQLVGASTGRESSAVQFGAALGDFWREIFDKKLKPLRFSRQAFIRSGLAAGFGAVFGVPWAGTLFALEATPSRRWSLRYLPLCWISSFGAHWIALWWGAHHKVYPVFPALPWNLLLIAKWSCLGIAFGVLAKVFVVLMQYSEKTIFGRISWPWLRPFVGGLAVAALTLMMKETRYNGLGVPLIDAALTSGVQTFDFAWKSLFTILSSASGLKGGEVTPLMAIGATFGVTISHWVALPSLYAASLGLVGVFASASHIPWTGAVMAWEFFGFEAFLPTFIICWLGRRVLGLHGLFSMKEP